MVEDAQQKMIKNPDFFYATMVFQNLGKKSQVIVVLFNNIGSIHII